MWNLVELVLPWLLPGAGAFLGLNSLFRGRFPPTLSWLPRPLARGRTLHGWLARAVGFVLVLQVVLAPMAWPVAEARLGPGPVRSPTTEGLEHELAQTEPRLTSLAQLRTRTEQKLASLRSGRAGLSEEEFQKKEEQLLDQGRILDAQDEKMRQFADQIRRSLEERQRADAGRFRSQVCVVRTVVGLVLLLASLGLAVGATVALGSRDDGPPG